MEHIQSKGLSLYFFFVPNPLLLCCWLLPPSAVAASAVAASRVAASRVAASRVAACHLGDRLQGQHAKPSRNLVRQPKTNLSKNLEDPSSLLIC